ncbi:MAG: lysophospholipid acyltransferase family protein [Jatrophihabitantaceae bacterium]
MTSDRVELSPAYRTVIGIGGLFMRLSRIEITGADSIPLSGPTVLIANHDSNWDPIALGYAARGRRQLLALAKSTLWKNPIVGKVLDGMGQIPIERGSSNHGAITAATQILRDGGCIGVFPEGTRSLGRDLRARSGAGRLVLAVPGTTIVCARVTGTTGRVWQPGGTSIKVEFFRPAGGQVRPEEKPEDLMIRMLAEVRDGAPPVSPKQRGRK